jgi:uncharacterized membrane protein YadS
LGGSFSAIAGAGFSALTLAILFGMVIGNTFTLSSGNPATAA